MFYLKIMLIGIILFLIDSIYLSFITPYYKNVVRSIQGSLLTIDYWGALLSYLCLIIAYIYFIYNRKGSLIDSIVLGFCIYGVYDGTTKALFKDYPWWLALTDTLWGGILFGLVYFVSNIFYI